MKMETVESTQDKESKGHLQTMTCELSLISRSDGSVYYHQRDTSVMVAVYGPGEVQLRNQIIDKATVDVVFKPKIGLPGCAEKLQERFLRNTCETVILASLYPRSLISIILQVLQDSGSLLACSINGACLALLDAAVPMKYTFAAVSCIIDSAGQVVLHPTLEDEKEAAAYICCTFNSSELKIVNLTTKGSFSNEQLQSCLLTCKAATQSVFDYYKDAMSRKLSKELKIE